MGRGIRLALAVLCHLRIEGRENLPASGPLIAIANHFHFLDPVAAICATPWPSAKSCPSPGGTWEDAAI